MARAKFADDLFPDLGTLGYVIRQDALEVQSPFLELVIMTVGTILTYKGVER